MATKISKHFFEFGFQKYFRGNAHLVEIGTYGEKKDPLGANAYLDPQNKVKREHLVNRVLQGSPINIDLSTTSKAALEGGGPIRVFGMDLSAAVGLAYEKVKTARLRLVNLSVAEGPLKTMLNKDADGARKYLANEGNDARIVSEIWVVMEAELAEQFATSGSVSVSAKGMDLLVTASGGKHGTKTITLSEGATFAYKLHKVKAWNKGKTEIENLEADYKGMG